jgi:FixJ family two-component response regulator/TPR repeat protein
MSQGAKDLMARGKVVILEDDSTLASAMKKAFEKIGFDAYMTPKSEEALEYIHKNPVAALFVDCLLPGGSGVDFVESIRSKFPVNALPIVMMSGIFTEAGMIKDTLRSTKAVAFLKKPFELQEALDCLKESSITLTREEDQSPRKALYMLFNKPKVSVREKRKAIEALEEIHGFDLPYLYSLMVETLATGHLNLVGGKGDVIGISFSNGKIISVDTTDQSTQLGKLLIEAGYLNPEDLKEALTSKSQKKLGERLIQSGLLSPHAFDIALANQMSIRLSRTIVDVPMKINFVATEVELTHPFIDSEALSVFLHDWVAAKISPEWLQAHYTQWGNYSLAKSSTYVADHPVVHMPLIAHFTGFVDYFTSGPTLSELMDKKRFPVETAYKALHLLLAKGLLIFAERGVRKDPEERLKFLKRSMAQFHNKNKLEIWDILVGMAGGSDSEPHFVISEFKKLLGPEPRPEERDISKLYAQLKKIADEALQFSQGGNREKMKEELAKQEVEMQIKAANLFEEAKQALHKSHFTQAADLLARAHSMDHSLERLKLYMLWARLAQLESASDKIQLLREVEMDLLQVPPEEKFDAVYSYVMGLYHKGMGDVMQAKKAFEKAYNLDSNLLAARREIAAIMQKSPKKDMLNRDLKDLVAGFFKKR